MVYPIPGVVKQCHILGPLLLLSVTSFTGVWAFTNPASSIQQSLRSQYRSVQLLNPSRVQSKAPDNVFVEGSDSTTDNDEDDRLLILARDFNPIPGKDASEIELPDGADVAAEGVLTGDGLFWRGVVVVLCALWASNFACAKIVLDVPGVDPSLYAVARFSLAFLALVPGSLAAARKGAISGDTARGAFLCGLWVAGGYLGQSVALQTTTPSRACVICALNCIFVAIVAELSRVRATEARGYDTAFEAKTLIPALIAVTGVAIIELKGAAGDPTVGDLIAFAQPIGFGMGYLQLEKLMKQQPSAAMPVSAIKLAVVASASLVYFEVARGGGLTLPDFTPILDSPAAVSAIFYTGLVTTSAALYVESIAFARVPATDASIILTTEPLFAAAVSAFLVGETFGAADAIGAFFIVGACIYAVRMGESEEVCDEETKKCVMEEL